MKKQFFLLVSTFILISCAKEDNPKPTPDEDNNEVPEVIIEPNRALELESSYTLQVSDVYLDGARITGPWPLFHNQAYADFNGDGHTDVIHAIGDFGSFNYSPVKLLLGDGSGVNADFCECGGQCADYVPCEAFTEKEDAFPVGFQGLQHPRKVLIGDYNKDGNIDAFLIGHGADTEPFAGESPMLLLNNGSGVFTATRLTNYVGFFHGGASADIDNDGDIDVFLAGDKKETTYFLINDGTGNFTANPSLVDDYTMTFGFGIFTADLIDIDKDGYFDLIIGGGEGDQFAEVNVPTTIYWGNSTGKYKLSLSTILPPVENYGILTDIDAEDIDGDGDRDVILARVSDNRVYGDYEQFYIQIIENTGGRNFVDKTSTRISDNTGFPWGIWVHLQDLDNDQDIDIYYEYRGDSNGNLKWINNGAGVFSLSN